MEQRWEQQEVAEAEERQVDRLGAAVAASSSGDWVGPSYHPAGLQQAAAAYPLHSAVASSYHRPAG